MLFFIRYWVSLQSGAAPVGRDSPCLDRRRPRQTIYTQMNPLFTQTIPFCSKTVQGNVMKIARRPRGNRNYINAFNE